MEIEERMRAREIVVIMTENRKMRLDRPIAVAHGHYHAAKGL